MLTQGTPTPYTPFLVLIGPWKGSWNWPSCSYHLSQVLKAESFSLMPSNSEGMVCKP